MTVEMRRELRAEFIRFALEAGVLRFGEFKTKAGRLSPYFFNAGLFNDGATLGALAEFYARTLLDAQKHPEKHRDLIVRVAGYSDYFANLTPELQDEIIRRTEQQDF